MTTETGSPCGIGELLRDLRLSLSWSQSRLADELCRVAEHATVTREDVSRWERGKRTPGPFWLRHLASALQVPIEILEGGLLDRRKFLTSAAGVAIAPVVVSDLIERGFAAALNGHGPSVDEWESTLAC